MSFSRKAFCNGGRNPNHPCYGGFQVVEIEHGGGVCGFGPFGYSADLDEVAEFVADHA